MFNYIDDRYIQHIPDSCWFCSKRATRYCDECNRPLCDECAISIGNDIDVCPEHNTEVYKKAAIKRRKKYKNIMENFHNGI